MAKGTHWNPIAVLCSCPSKDQPTTFLDSDAINHNTNTRLILQLQVSSAFINNPLPPPPSSSPTPPRMQEWSVQFSFLVISWSGLFDSYSIVSHQHQRRNLKHISLCSRCFSKTSVYHGRKESFNWIYRFFLLLTSNENQKVMWDIFTHRAYKLESLWLWGQI